MNNVFKESSHAPRVNGLKWLFLDLNSYFASVEQNDNPNLRGKPVAVVPMMTDATSAIAASYEAKIFGVKTGTKIYEAKKMCPELICIQANHEKYVHYHHKIIEAAEKILPVNKTWSVDEFDCLLLGQERKEENAIALARRMQAQLHKDVGPNINCSIGIAPLDRLQRAGINSVEKLYNTSPKHARAIWRSVQGERFWYWLHGYDIPYQPTKPSMLGHSRMLDPNLRNAEKTRQMARRLLFKACYRLRHKDLYAKNLVVKFTFINRQKWVAVRDFPASQDPFMIMKMLEDIWQNLLQECFNGRTPSPRKMIFLKVSTLLLGLTESDCITDDLFEHHIAKQSDQTEKQTRLASALDHLQKKYKKETVWLGIVPETLAGNVGTKIAFNRVPDKEEFWH